MTMAQMPHVAVSFTKTTSLAVNGCEFGARTKERTYQNQSGEMDKLQNPGVELV